MFSSLQFTKNLAAIGFLIVLILGAAITSLLLSPITPADLANSGSTAGAYTDQSAEIVSNFIPLEVVDTAHNNEIYSTQLIKVGERSYNYFIKVLPHQTGEFYVGGLEFHNLNNADVEVTFSASIPAASASSVSVYVDDYYTRLALHSAYPQLTRNRVFTIPTKAAHSVVFGFDYDQDLSYPLEVMIQVVF